MLEPTGMPLRLGQPLEHPLDGGHELDRPLELRDMRCIGHRLDHGVGPQGTEGLERRDRNHPVALSPDQAKRHLETTKERPQVRAQDRGQRCTDALGPARGLEHGTGIARRQPRGLGNRSPQEGAPNRGAARRPSPHDPSHRHNPIADRPNRRSAESGERPRPRREPGRRGQHERQAACVVAPGPHETFGLAVLEAAASGARVVACSSTPAATLAGPLVHTFTPKDPSDLARAVERALVSQPDPALGSALAAGLSWQRVFEAELRELKRLCR